MLLETNRQNFIKNCVNELQKIANQYNYGKISIKTLKEILTTYINTYGPVPKLPYDEQEKEGLLSAEDNDNNVVLLFDKQNSITKNNEKLFKSTIRENKEKNDILIKKRNENNKRLIRTIRKT